MRLQVPTQAARPSLQACRDAHGTGLACTHAGGPGRDNAGQRRVTQKPAEREREREREGALEARGRGVTLGPSPGERKREREREREREKERFPHPRS